MINNEVYSNARLSDGRLQPAVHRLRLDQVDARVLTTDRQGNLQTETITLRNNPDVSLSDPPKSMRRRQLVLSLVPIMIRHQIEVLAHRAWPQSVCHAVVLNSDYIALTSIRFTIAKASSGSVFLFDEIDRWLFCDSGVNEDYAAMLMSILDGTASPTGAIIVLVTNNLQKIPEAMRRPGRVVTREWGYVTSENAYRLFNFVFPNINEQKLRTTAQEYVRIYNSETASVLTEKLRGQPEFDAFRRAYLH